MNIRLESLNSGVVDKIDIKESISFSSDYLDNSEIVDLKDVYFEGKIYRNTSEELVLEGKIDGTMILKDSISLDNVEYNFSSNIEEILENNENSIDIIPILWQNIVLEVPLKFTKVNDFSSYSGDGWRLISEGEVPKNNPFLELQEKFKEE